MVQEVLKFWFEEIQPKMWWATDAAFDGLLRDRFLPLLVSAAQGELVD